MEHHAAFDLIRKKADADLPVLQRGKDTFDRNVKGYPASMQVLR